MPTIVNYRAFTENISNDPAVIQELLEIFEAESENILAELKLAIKSVDIAHVHILVHSLKGVCTNLMVIDEIADEFRKYQAATKTENLSMAEYNWIEEIVDEIRNNLTEFMTTIQLA